MTRKTATSHKKEKPQAMVKRLFAIAEIIVRSETYPKDRAQSDLEPAKTRD